MNDREEYEQWANALDEGQDEDDGYMERTYEAHQSAGPDRVSGRIELEPPQLG
ncbi:hypothetical protein [Pseudomonas sp. PDM13]|uniref:hypothetical protein n=1 Tax=Pseudomonas sp. PDM13 TaxID=2769255 RepID=UPI0021E090B3|nr:hypothetical protein [Pseudomonas sp. PDM13]MCU9948253.1 hypothetical protein [Pseudomonas sp. PDM13]MCU9948268.1 hypothetical protein [Pseudomonas sp. PDM13]